MDFLANLPLLLTLVKNEEGGLADVLGNFALPIVVQAMKAHSLGLNSRELNHTLLIVKECQKRGDSPEEILSNPELIESASKLIEPLKMEGEPEVRSLFVVCPYCDNKYGVPLRNRSHSETLT